MSDIAECWSVIDEWLVHHAPATYRYLQGPATDSDLKAAELTLGPDLPGELVESLRCHNGFANESVLFPDGYVLSAEQIASTWQQLTEIDGDSPALPQESGEPWWHPLWIPFAKTESATQVVDMRVGPLQGRLGMAGADDVGYFDDGWSNVNTYLRAIVHGLQTGESVGTYEQCAFITEDGELWWDDVGTMQLNGKPLHRAT